MTGPVEHRCLHPGCRGIACYGFGLAHDAMIWACSQHREEGERRYVRHRMPGQDGTSAYDPAQGRLL